MSDPFQTTRAGIGNVGSYQVSGYPFVTGSTVSTNGQEAIFFPTVTKKIFIASRAAGTLRVHFASVNNTNVVGGNHFVTLPSSGTLDLEVKCTSIYISAPGTSVGGKFEIVAGLTNIPKYEMYALSGSGITE